MDSNSRQDKCLRNKFLFSTIELNKTVNLFTYKRYTSVVASVFISFGQTRMRAKSLTHSSKGQFVSEKIIERSTNWSIVNTQATEKHGT